MLDYVKEDNRIRSHLSFLPSLHYVGSAFRTKPGAQTPEQADVYLCKALRALVGVDMGGVVVIGSHQWITYAANTWWVVRALAHLALKRMEDL